MADFILLMHNDGGSGDPQSWDAYLTRLQAADILRGGSAIGGGGCYRKDGVPDALTEALSGYIKIEAADMAAAQAWLKGNPVYENGGTVEIRDLPRSE